MDDPGMEELEQVARVLGLGHRFKDAPKGIRKCRDAIGESGDKLLHEKLEILCDELKLSGEDARKCSLENLEKVAKDCGVNCKVWPLQWDRPWHETLDDCLKFLGEAGCCRSV